MNSDNPPLVRLVPKTPLGPVGRWRSTAIQMIAADKSAIVPTFEDSRALAETLRRLGYRPIRRKLDGEGWSVSVDESAHPLN